MSFSDISGSPVLRASEEPYDRLYEFVNKELSEDDDTELKKKRVGDIALAVGISEGRREGSVLGDEEVTFNLGSLDPDGVMKIIIEERHPEQGADGLRKLIGEYLRGGVQQIGEEIESDGVFDYHSYLSEPPAETE